MKASVGIKAQDGGGEGVNGRFGFIRAAAGLFEVSLGQTHENAGAMAALMDEARCAQVDVLVFPELSLTGYTLGDLFLRRELCQNVEHALGEVLKASETICPDMIVCLGLPVWQGSLLFNAACILQGGRILGIVPKSWIPNSREFYERRWFAPASARRTDEIELCGQMVPFTPNLLVESGPLVLACEICEDLWVNMPPSARHTAAGANLVVNLSASNEVATKSAYRRDLVRMHSGSCLSAYVYASAGPGESSTDLVFSGHSLICANARVLAESRDRLGLTCAVVDLERLENERLQDPCFLQGAGEVVDMKAYVRVRANALPETGLLPENVEPMPFVPRGEELGERCQEILGLQAHGLARRVKKARAQTLVVGISGGLDSTLALLVAADACDRLGLPRSSILAVTMPGFGTTERTKTNALALMELVGARTLCVDIRPACEGHLKDIGHEEGVYDTTFENAQARERTQILMDLANKENGLVVGTGDMSELALGWATYNGDHMSMYGVNAGVPKTLVRFLVEEYGVLHPEVAEVLASICATEISPELLPPDAAGNRQSTEGTIGKYVLHDFFLFNYVRCGFSVEKIRALARIAFATKDGAGETAAFDSRNAQNAPNAPNAPNAQDVEDAEAGEILASVDRTLDIFVGRFFAQQFKRSCLPDGPKVGTVALSPRGDWRMPSDMDPMVE